MLNAMRMPYLGQKASVNTPVKRIKKLVRTVLKDILKDKESSKAKLRQQQMKRSQ
ncbi:hypothetical protein [Borrelia persica]|uniref:hypothetical protein n=1 Tax=Borrelia persica TaxID=44448 RepID=UPI0004BBF43E|nr:hypothetical protein [Borrelia persica]